MRGLQNIKASDEVQKAWEAGIPDPIQHPVLNEDSWTGISFGIRTQGARGGERKQ